MAEFQISQRTRGRRCASPAYSIGTPEVLTAVLSRRILTALLEHSADRGSLLLGDGEHRWSMGARIRPRNQLAATLSSGRLPTHMHAVEADDAQR
jgi:hypothetical protein